MPSRSLASEDAVRPWNAPLTARSEAEPRRRRTAVTARMLVAAACTVATVLAVAAAGLAWRLELSGLGRPRDTDPRLPYLALLGLAVVVPLAVTVATYRWGDVDRTNDRGRW